MKSWVRFENGHIVEGPIGQEEQPKGYIEYVEVIDLPYDHGEPTVTIELVDGKCVKTVTAGVDYRRARLRNYPSVGDQLDMLWHAMNSEQIPKVEPFFSQIQTVKDSYPKG